MKSRLVSTCVAFLLLVTLSAAGASAATCFDEYISQPPGFQAELNWCQCMLDRYEYQCTITGGIAHTIGGFDPSIEQLFIEKGQKKAAVSSVKPVSR